MIRRGRFRWVMGMLGIVLGVLVASCGPNADETAGPAIIDLYGYPFLIPQEYFMGEGQSGTQSELALIASLPGVGPDGKSAQEEWAQGSPRLLLIGVFPPSLYTEMGVGKLYPEQVVDNLINLFDRNQRFYDSFPQDISFKRDWGAFVQQNANREDQVLDATQFLAWDSIGTPPDESYQTAFVVISKGRIVMFGTCGTPRPDRDDYSPGCTSYYQKPGDVFSLKLIYRLKHRENSFSIAKQLSERLSNFNKAAVAHLGHGKLAFASDYPQ